MKAIPATANRAGTMDWQSWMGTNANAFAKLAHLGWLVRLELRQITNRVGF